MNILCCDHPPFRASAYSFLRFCAAIGLPILLLLGVVIAKGGALRAAEFPQSAVADRIAQQIRARQANQQFTCQGELICGIALIPEFYAARNFKPIWTTPRGPVPQALALLEEIRNVAADGLVPQDYHYPRLQVLAAALAAPTRVADQALPGVRADFDVLMTDAAFLLGAHIVGGRVNPEAVHTNWSAFSLEVDLIRLLNDSLQGGRVAHMFQGLHPPYTGYTGLRRALAAYRRMAEKGVWPRLDEGPSLRREDDSPAVAQLRRRLLASGDLPERPSLRPTYFDAELESAVKGFQYRHGLDPDGVVGPKTRAALNVPLAQRIDQLLINMERWRWIPDDLGRRYLAVNIADFKLTMVDEGRVRGTMPVVVGRTYRKTPVFSGTMTYLEFNPYWNIPRRLAVEDILPKILNDSGYIDEQGIRIFSGWSQDAELLAPGEVDWASLSKDYFPIRLQQAPGPLNALGRIKFMFPNRHAVYLHDTPAKNLFNAVSRSFSSGCIRVEDPVGLAAFVLDGTAGWDRETIETHYRDGEHRVVRLQRPIPVHLLYWTAWADSEGTVFFREDIYGRDAPLLRALQEKPAPPRWRPVEALPGTHPADVDVDEIGLRIVADPAAG